MPPETSPVVPATNIPPGTSPIVLATDMPPETSPVVLAIDPGSAKCGVAVVSRGGDICCRAIVPTAELVEAVRRLVEQYRPVRLVCGKGTGSRPILRDLACACLDVELTPVDECYTSEAARARFVAENPATGLARLLPTCLRTPPIPYDDYVAIILAERFWSQQPPAAG